MKTITKAFLFILLVISFSCDDLLEEDITNDNIVIISPTDNAVVVSNAVTFQWNSLDGADKYRLQVYSDSQNMVLDSLVTSTNFVYALNPGNYQWRVRGENFAYQTAYTFPNNFTLNETDDLGQQIITLLTPSSGLTTNNGNITFTWSSINAATDYQFQILNISDGSNIVYQQENFTGTSITVDSTVFTADGQYQWKVKAFNTDNATETAFSSRNFTIDTTPPNQPVNTLPASDATSALNSAVAFEWNAPTDNGVVTSSLTYTIQIATSQSFSDIYFSDTTNFDNYNFTFSTTGIYYWRVKATDAANNQGNYSIPYKITIQ